MVPTKSSGSGAFLSLGLLAGLVLIIAPWFISTDVIPKESRLILAGFGALLALVFGVLVIITRLYRKASADEAFVRTGVGGRKCVIDGGALVVPVVHNVIPVSLRTFKLEVNRTGPDALITADFLRADVNAVFYVRVQKDPRAIEQAATSLGALSGDARSVENLIQDKLVSALRTVAATQILHDLNSKRAEFAEAVQKIVAQDLQPNGLTLEAVNISKLDQAPLGSMKPEENVFDAQGARTIAEQVQAQRVSRNTIQREADQKVKEQDVKTAQYVAHQDVQQAKALADAESQKAMARAEAGQRARTFEAEQGRLANVAQVEAERLVDLSKVEKTKVVEVANQQREQATQVAEVGKQQAVEVARRQQQIAIAEAERNRAMAEAAQLAAQREREAKAQEVQTVEVTMTAEREKSKAVIAKQAEAEQSRIERQMQADVAAYAEVKRAEAEQNAAEKQARARVSLAEADREAKTLEAEGDRNVRMVPVNVAAEQVKVSDSQVTVDIRRLEGQTRFEKIAKELQVQLAAIEAEKQAKIAAAQAFGEALAKANLNLWGDPAAVEKISHAFFSGQAIATYAGGVLASLPSHLRELVKKATGVDVGSAGGGDGDGAGAGAEQAAAG